MRRDCKKPRQIICCKCQDPGHRASDCQEKGKGDQNHMQGCTSNIVSYARAASRKKPAQSAEKDQRYEERIPGIDVGKVGQARNSFEEVLNISGDKRDIFNQKYVYALWCMRWAKSQMQRLMMETCLITFM